MLFFARFFDRQAQRGLAPGRRPHARRDGDLLDQGVKILRA